MTDSKFVESRMVMGQNGVSRTITAEHSDPNSPKVAVDGIEIAGDLNWKGRHESASRVYSKDGISPTLPCGTGGGVIPKVDIMGEVEGGVQSNNTKTKIVVPDIEIKGKLNEKGHFDCIQRVYGKDGASPTVTDHVPMMEDDD